jgi:D-tyrosyl-tRNA(Tyr) deacylase
LQRVSQAAIEIDGEMIASIGSGILVLVGVVDGDGEINARKAARKIAGLRLFGDSRGRMNLSVGDVGGDIMVVSQFTLAGSIDRGRRPSFDKAAAPEIAEPLLDLLVTELESAGHAVERGRFGAHMKIELVNDGPVTFVLDS